MFAVEVDFFGGKVEGSYSFADQKPISSLFISPFFFRSFVKSLTILESPVKAAWEILKIATGWDDLSETEVS